MMAADGAGLFLKVTKSQMFPDELRLLGHLLSFYGFRACLKRIEALQKARPPRDKKQLKGFLCAVSLYFVPRMSEITSPLRPGVDSRTRKGLSEPRSKPDGHSDVVGSTGARAICDGDRFK
eukprot:GHVN01105188.1.p2 GENE.GHVN01105188.1~~GHVN01105188.1.p2  ORF type:complete len:121 (-),score=7.33 GHVN01105188.1:396-758(-)